MGRGIWRKDARWQWDLGRLCTRVLGGAHARVKFRVEEGTRGNVWAGIEDGRDAARELVSTQGFIELAGPGPLEGDRRAEGGSCDADDGSHGRAGECC